MKNVTSLKSQNSSQSPKTPGGISKSLLTPCRRVGLSRNWKKSGVSPFVSPLTGTPSSEDVKTAQKETRKRKQRLHDEDTSDDVENKSTPILRNNSCESNVNEYHDKDSNEATDLIGTPTRLSVELPRRKRSKALLSVLNEAETNNTGNLGSDLNKTCENLVKEDFTPLAIENPNIEEIEDTETPPSLIKSKSQSKKSLKTNIENNKQDCSVNVNPSNGKMKNQQKSSPPDLTKKCMVVIQKKIFKHDIVKDNGDKNIKASQDILDSDDDVPLCQLSSKEITGNIMKDLPKSTNDEDDFEETIIKPKVKKLADKKTSTGDLKANIPSKSNVKTKKDSKPVKKIAKTELNPSQITFDDDDDFDYSNKRTIVIKKTYSKVDKPVKAKSTGSITQKDIDELKARIEVKKKMLLANAMTEDTEELRNLIKKWQRGCQDALVELMDLMVKKFPEKQFSDYSEILKMLNIPASLVGYDSENDCFNTPDDASIILSKFND